MPEIMHCVRIAITLTSKLIASGRTDFCIVWHATIPVAHKSEKWGIFAFVNTETSDIDSIVQQATTVLQRGGILLYPTDTIWGIGCDAGNVRAVERIYTVKRRDPDKALLVLALRSMLSPALPSAAYEILTASDRPTTLIMPQEWVRSKLADNLCASDGSIGVRIPRHTLCQQLLHALGRPIVSTSANFSGDPSPRHYKEISPRLVEAVDYCVEPLPSLLSTETSGSHIVKMTGDGTPITLRN